MQTSPCSGLFLIAAVSSVATATVITYGIGTVVESILDIFTHPVSTFIVGGIIGFYISVVYMRAGYMMAIKEREKQQLEQPITNNALSNQ
jgi:H+/Cl- antiporter ClcA